MEGLYINKSADLSVFEFGKCQFSLNFKHDAMEVITQKLDPESVIWISPSENLNTLEFYYVVSGDLSVISQTGEYALTQGDSFYTEQLVGEIQLKINRPTTLLCVTNTADFDDLISYEGNLEELMDDINQKDAYTSQHGRNVMNYSLKVMEQFTENRMRIDQIGVAALFHDIGKYFVPVEVLQKKGRLTPGELKYIMKHPIDSKRLLQKRFGSEVAEIAEQHHERLDGSGYPYSLQGDEICFESRIIAVADALDAMTTDRGYNNPKTMEGAIEELLGLTEQYDERVLRAFEKLILEHKFTEVKNENS